MLDAQSTSGDTVQPSLDAIHLDATGYAFQGEPQPGQLSVWHTPDNDGLGVRFLAVPPDFPPNAVGVEELAEFMFAVAGSVICCSGSRESTEQHASGDPE